MSSSVCLSVTFMHPTKAIKFLATFLCHLVPLPPIDIQVEFYRDRPRGTPPLAELNTRGVAKYSAFGSIECYSSETVQDRSKLVLITNRKSHMSFRLVPNSVTLDDLQRRNSLNHGLISTNSVGFGADYVKVIGDTLILSAAKM